MANGPAQSADTFGPNNDGFYANGHTTFTTLEGKPVVSTTPVYGTPWNVSNVTSPFFPSHAIDGTRWDQFFPYRFIVIDVTQNNAIVNGAAPSTLNIQVSKGTSSSTINISNWGSQWIFELPITPQQLNIQDTFAINTTATLRGILEEHNGVKFKMINAAGTFGIWPNRADVPAPPQTPPSVLQSVFGGTIAAAGNLASSVQGIVNTATGNHPASTPITPRPESINDGLVTTGYYCASTLQQFLEQYAEAKKNPKNAGWRLVFDVPKQNQSFIVTPMQYTWRQDVSKAMEIQFSMQLKAWRRINLNERVKVTSPNITPLSPGILQRIMNTLFAARQTVSSALNLIGAVRSDVEAPLEALRQTTLLVKGIAGAFVTAADLPNQIISAYKSSLASTFSTMNTSSLTGDAATNTNTAVTLNTLNKSTANNEGLSVNAVNNGQLGTSASQSQSANPALNMFSNPAANFLLLDQLPVNSLTLDNAQQNAVNAAIAAANALTINDLKQFRSTIQTLALQLSNNFGTGDAFYSKVYNFPAPISRIVPISLDNYELLDCLYDTMQSYDLLTASTQIDDNDTETNMEYVAGLANNSGIQFNIPNSMIVAPVPFGLTVEGIAARYLGDPQRWIEIVTLNNLREPYIDENGFQVHFLSNATGRQVVVADASQLYLQQAVLIQSATQIPSARLITGIQRLSNTSYLITFDGLPNLNNFLLVDQAYIQAYLPGTVNSQQKIFIPSDVNIPNNPNIIVPSLASADPLEGLSMVDLLLTSSGDIAVNSYGDFRYSYGMTNLIQALMIKFGTVAGSVLLHPEFGVGVRPGTSIATLSAQDLFNSINQQVTQDPRFQSVSGLQLIQNGPTLSINLQIQLANQAGVFPLSFKLTNNTD
jgi:hypothetical protein